MLFVVLQNVVVNYKKHVINQALQRPHRQRWRAWGKNEVCIVNFIYFTFIEKVKSLAAEPLN